MLSMTTSFHVDTIAAIATAPGEAGISIVRVSGPDSLPLADKIFRCAPPSPSARADRTIVYGHMVDNLKVIDQVILLIMRGPKSFTGEDVVEFQGHGGQQCAKRLLRCVLDAGARLAQPGEFSQRAFLNGRLDLVQAEAVLDLIRARSDRAASAALEQLEGSLSRQFNTLYDHLMDIAADIEATLDFPEEDIPAYVIPDIVARIEKEIATIDALLATWDEGHLLRDGATIVISGKPNVGKSTMLNTLLKRDRAIVSNIPGTTRDSIEEDFSLHGIPIRLIDTAGLRETVCEIEQVGIERTRKHLERADLQIYMVDAGQGLDEEDRRHIEAIPAARRLVVFNKADLVREGTAIKRPGLEPCVTLSLLNPASREQLIEAITYKLSSHLDLSARPHAAIAERHRGLLRIARHELVQAHLLLTQGGADSETDEDAPSSADMAPLASDRMRGALDALGEVTGRVYHDEIVNNVFSRFCIGK